MKDFKEAVAQETWKSHRRVVDHDLKLRESNPGAGDKFLSKCFRVDQQFSIALTDPETGCTQSPQEMIQTLQHEYLSHAQNDFVQDADAARAILSQLSGPFQLYTPEEGEAALSLMKPGKAVTHGSFLALRAAEPAGSRLSLALANLSRYLCLTSAHWSLRVIKSLRKSGPKVVRRVKNLRGVSIATDMASLQVALWVGRNGKRLEDYAGIDQHGGVGDPLMMVFALVLHIQLRYFQGLDTWLALADLKLVFDVADIPSMLVCAFEAGVCGEDWLLLDDFISMDRQRISLMGLLSPLFVLGCGKAQGRRFSDQVFNSFLRWLKEEVKKI